MIIDKDNIKILLIILVVGLGLGYAYINSDLNINGTAQVNSANWDVHWANIQVKNGSVSAPSPTISNGTTVNYSVTLNQPGDYYEFTVDAVNAGSIDAMVDIVDVKLNGTSITESNIEDLPIYLLIGFCYLDGTPISPNHQLMHNTSETYKAIIKYSDNVDPSKLPTDDKSLNITISVTYRQMTENAQPVRNYLFRLNKKNVSFNSPVTGDEGYCVVEKTVGEQIECRSNLADCESILQYYGNHECRYEIEKKLGRTTNTSQELMNSTGKQFFIRHNIYDDKVVQSSVGFIMNDNEYYLIGGSEGCLYEDNKDLLISLFGENNCNITYSLTGSLGYSCEKPSEWSAEAFSNGEVYVYDLHRRASTSSYCYVDHSGFSYCDWG